MADTHSPTDPAAPSEAYWAFVPQSPGTAALMVQRARAAGRTLAPEIYALAGEPVPPAAPPPPEPPADPYPARAPEPALTSAGVFTRERRVRFLDHLAVTGNVRAAAAQAGVDHATAYRARRQDEELAGLWDAALVHARDNGADVLATRALHGVTSEVWHRGEVVGTRVHYDARLLLAHLARLDRRVEGDAAALARAARFDELLAGYAGVAEPEAFPLAAEAARDPVPLPPTRAGYVAWLREAVVDDLEQQRAGDEGDHGDEDGEALDRLWLETVAEAEHDAAAEWDEWRAEGRARLAAIVEAPAGPHAAPPEEPPAEPAEEPPVEFKSAPRGRPIPVVPRRPVFRALDSVASVASAEARASAPGSARPSPAGPPPARRAGSR